MTRNLVYTDGGGAGNPGIGAWSAIIVLPDKDVILRGGELFTTNNKMELSAVINAFEFITLNTEWLGEKWRVFTDSEYVKKGITEWIKNWEKNGWKTAAKKPVKNKHLWKQLKMLDNALKIEWQWIRGHSGNDNNERCDNLVQEMIQKLESIQ
jgi:ribonuclease HI